MSLKHKISRVNEAVALKGTQMFGSMWMAYLFMIWGALGILPFLPVGFKNLVLLVSSAWIQLWALPLLAVGSNVLNRKAERRALEDHLALKLELALIKEEMAVIHAMDKKLDTLELEVLQEVKAKLDILLSR